MERQNLIRLINEHQLDVIYAASSQTRLWWSKINTSDGHLFIKANLSADLFLDGRYFEFGSKFAKNVDLHLLKPNALNDYALKHQSPYQTIGVEAEYLTVSQFNALKQLFPQAKFIEVSAKAFRLLKSEDEIKLIAKAGEIALKALAKLELDIKPGISEKALDAKLEFYLRSLGAEKGSFDAIIASGHRGSLPHGRASDKVLADNELVTIDFGAIYQGFCSDITRTFHVGKVTNERLLEIERVLREAQVRGVKAVKPGAKASEIDKVCRDYIESQGFGAYFTHSTGHGLGIDVHELPYISSNPKLDCVLEPGMVFTVEPGIYIPGLGGIRVEDNILVTNDGYRVLSKLD